MTIDLEQLETLAKAAAAGPWLERHEDVYSAVDAHIAFCLTVCSSADEHCITKKQAQANAAFIAAANPQTALELIAELRKAVNTIRKEREARNWLATMLGEYGKEDGSAQEWLNEAKRIAGIITEEQLQKLNNRRTPNE